MTTTPKEKVRWVAEVSYVKELRLIGMTDADVWSDIRMGEFSPVQHDGKTPVTLAATDLKWKGVPFSEFAVTVPLQTPQGQQAAYLMQAFNSNRLFSFCERTFFKTPYDHAYTYQTFDDDFSMSVHSRTETFCTAYGDVGTFTEAEESWEGPVLFTFYSRVLTFRVILRGVSRIYPAVNARVEFGAHPELQRLAGSGFVPFEWRWREDAFHAKSQTTSFEGL